MRKLLLDHFISSTSLPNEFEEHFLPIFSHQLMNIAENITDIVKLGRKLMNAALSPNLVDIDWRKLELTKLALWMQLSYLPYFLCISLCMEMPSQVLTVLQKLCDDLAALSLVRKNLVPIRNVGAFSIYKKIRKFSIGNFRLGKARSICHKAHSREAWPLNRPRKAWKW